MIQNLSIIKCPQIKSISYDKKLDAFSVLSSKEVICVFIVIVVKEEEVL